MSLLSLLECRPLIETTLSDAELQLVIDRVETEITAVVGVPGDGVTTLTEALSGYARNLFLKRPIASITSVTEYATLDASTGETLTNGTHFYAWPDEARLERINGSWRARATVIYVPQDDRLKRKQAIIDLVRLWIDRTAFKAEGVAGELSYTAPENWELEKRRIIRRLQFVEV